MTKKELIESLKGIPDDMEILASSKEYNDIFEILCVKDLDDGVAYLEIGSCNMKPIK